MNIKLRNSIIIAILILFSGCNHNELLLDIPVEKISSNLDKTIPILMTKHNIVGLSVVAIYEGKISIAKSFGYADIESKKKMDKHSVFRAALLGKPIFAYMVVLLAQQGKIDLDIPLYTYLTTSLPNFDGKQSKLEFLFDPGQGFEYSGPA